MGLDEVKFQLLEVSALLRADENKKMKHISDVIFDFLQEKFIEDDFQEMMCHILGSISKKQVRESTYKKIQIVIYRLSETSISFGKKTGVKNGKQQKNLHIVHDEKGENNFH